eukprot:Nk52_evm7s32 gene=Nk52_evmTU7s32
MSSSGVMKAVVCYGPRKYVLEERPIPTPRPGEVLIRVLSCGICAGDAKCFQGAPHFWSPGPLGPSYCEPPVIPGHEFAGEVVGFGREVSNGNGEECDGVTEENWKKIRAVNGNDSEVLKVGDVVVCEVLVGCGWCRFCVGPKQRTSRGEEVLPSAPCTKEKEEQERCTHMCMEHTIYGFRQRSHGGMAEYMVLLEGSRIYRLDPRLVLLPGQKNMKEAEQKEGKKDPLRVEHVAYCEPLSCGIYAGRLGLSVEGQGGWTGQDVEALVVVSGAGAVGLGSVAYLHRLRYMQQHTCEGHESAVGKYRRVGVIVALDMLDWKLEVALKAGADVVVNMRSGEGWGVGMKRECLRREGVPLVDSVKTRLLQLRGRVCDYDGEGELEMEGQKRREQGGRRGTGNSFNKDPRLSGYWGCDVYLEMSGHPSSVTQGLELLCKRGTFVQYGLFGEQTRCDWTVISDTKELCIRGGHLSPYGCFGEAVAMLVAVASADPRQQQHQQQQCPRIPVRDIVSAVYPMSEVEEALEKVCDSSSTIKVVLLPSFDRCSE